MISTSISSTHSTFSSQTKPETHEAEGKWKGWPVKWKNYAEDWRNRGLDENKKNLILISMLCLLLANRKI